MNFVRVYPLPSSQIQSFLFQLCKGVAHCHGHGVLHRLLGTQTDEQWPGVTSLRDWHVYPRWEPQNLARAVPSLGPDGIDLLSKMLRYDPADRISAKSAMDHPYFDSLDKSQF